MMVTETAAESTAAKTTVGGDYHYHKILKKRQHRVEKYDRRRERARCGE